MLGGFSVFAGPSHHPIAQCFGLVPSTYSEAAMIGAVLAEVVKQMLFFAVAVLVGVALISGGIGYAVAYFGHQPSTTTAPALRAAR